MHVVRRFKRWMTVGRWGISMTEIKKKEEKFKVASPMGRIVDATDLDFEPISEPWASYRLDDGTVIKARLVVNKVVRMDEWDPITGEPMYNVSHQIVVRATQVSAELRKKPEAKQAPNPGIA
jgi:hypothetical protein